MWRPDPQKLIKIQLQSLGEDVETPWAEDLGPAEGPTRARRVRLANVPFLHAKPTYGDVIVAEPDAEGVLVWDSEGAPWEDILARLDEDGERWAMIVDYGGADENHDGRRVFSALSDAAEAIDVCIEGCWGPERGRPGRAYLAVPAGLTVAEVMARLSSIEVPATLTLVHPRDEEV